MTDKLIEILESFGYPVRLRTYLLGTDTMPETLITYEETASEDGRVYDNSEHAVKWSYTVTIISTNPQTTLTVAKDLKKKLKGTDFTMQGLGTGFSADGTGYVGRNCYIHGVERD